MIQKNIEKILKGLARAVLKRQRPRVVTVTGSVGKTSTKEAIYVVLKSKFRVRRSVKNYNNEIGVPMTIFGTKSPGKNILGWFWVYMKAVWLGSFKHKEYPQILILELGADKPGDLEYLMEMIPSELLKAAVLTAVSPAHLEFFGTMEKVLEEKTTPFKYLPENGKAIINKDCVNYDKADVFYSLDQAMDMTSQFVYPHQAYAPLAGIAVGKVFGISEQEAKQALLKNYKILPGRGRKIKGVSGSTIIDDTYNSSPLSAKRALEALKKLSCSGRRVAVLGDMLELGEGSSRFHREVGKLAAELQIDYLVAYGKEAENIAEGAEVAGMPQSNILRFRDLEKIVDFLKNLIQAGDAVLIKGSQGVRMEKIVKALMAEPKKAGGLLVRQNKEWLKK